MQACIWQDTDIEEGQLLQDKSQIYVTKREGTIKYLDLAVKFLKGLIAVFHEP